MGYRWVVLTTRATSVGSSLARHYYLCWHASAAGRTTTTNNTFALSPKAFHTVSLPKTIIIMNVVGMNTTHHPDIVIGHHSRGRSLERFEASLKRLDPPPWMRQQRTQSESTTADNSLSQNTVTLTNDDLPSNTRPRWPPRTTIRTTTMTSTSTSNSYWRTPSSRGPSPGPGSRPATAGGRFQSSSLSRYSSSTLCSDGNISNGNNTPTDSVTSAFSMRSGVQTEPIYHPPNYPAPILNRSKPLPHMQRPYLGWRSQDSLINTGNEQDLYRSSRAPKYLTPAERLAHTYHHTRSRSSSSNRGYGAAAAKQYHHNHHQRPPPPVGCLSRNYASDQIVHDSIKSVSSAIMEFCS